MNDKIKIIENMLKIEQDTLECLKQSLNDSVINFNSKNIADRALQIRETEAHIKTFEDVLYILTTNV